MEIRRESGMNKKWWTGIAIVLLILAFFFTGGIAYESGYSIGLGEGYATRVAETKAVIELPPPIPYWSGEPEEPDWGGTLADIFEEIDSANITIHIEDKEGVRADIHISWNK